MLDFRGRWGSAARSLVISSVKDELTLVRRSEAVRTGRQLGVSLGSSAGIRRVANEMNIDLVIRGRVQGRGRRMKVVVIVHSADGDVLAKRTEGPPTGRRGRRRVETATAEAVREALDQLRPTAPEPPAERPVDARDESEHRGKPQDGAPEPPPETPPTEPAAEREREGAKDDAPTDDEDQDEAAQPERPRGKLPLLSLQVGGAARTRDAHIRLPDGTKRIYDSRLFPQIELRFELRPWAQQDSAARGLYLMAAGGFWIAASSSEQSTEETVDTSTYHVHGALGYVFDLADDSVQLGITAGFHYDTFVLAENDVMPSATYMAPRGDLMLRFDLVERLFYGSLEAGGIYAFDVGALADAFGIKASAMGVDATVAVGGITDAGFTYRVGGSYRRFWLDFAGEAQDTKADSGTDEAWSAQALVGWSLR